MIELERAKSIICDDLSDTSDNAFACKFFTKPIIEFSLAPFGKAHKDADASCGLPFITNQPCPTSFGCHALQIALHNLAKILNASAAQSPSHVFADESPISIDKREEFLCLFWRLEFKAEFIINLIGEYHGFFQSWLS